MLPKPPRLLVEVEVLVVPELPEDDERPATVEGGLLDDVRGVVVVVVSRLPLPPHHHQPVLDEVREPPLLLRELELQRSGCHRPVFGSWRQTEAPVWRSWQASTVG
ncbi:hypothetical protein [Vineibacter terrae]|uniref:hypothetical protein n=1 Tax=Vineibacter terrae TaxID=2586908 RepID=UPI002E32F5DE|nr:hypothetical protein [Vineibacter terrae]HEX2887743.1 hypothetical protein [Vineibacter terrae]